MTRIPLVLGLALVVNLPTAALLPGICLAGSETKDVQMSTTRRDNYEKFKLEREERQRQEKYEKARVEREERYEEYERKQRLRREYGEDPDNEKDFQVRTLGGACMYGAKGEVVYRPRGAWCKGDPESPESEPYDSAPYDAAPEAPAELAPESRGAVESRAKRKKGRCVYGRGGKLVFKPSDVDC